MVIMYWSASYVVWAVGIQDILTVDGIGILTIIKGIYSMLSAENESDIVRSVEYVQELNHK